MHRGDIGADAMTDYDASASQVRASRIGYGGGKRGAATMQRLREGLVTDEEEKKRKGARWTELPLKRDAGRMEMVIARSIARDLTDLLEHHPDHFLALWSIVEGRSSQVTDRIDETLQNGPIFCPMALRAANVVLIMAAALRDAADGPVVVNPLDATRPDDAAPYARRIGIEKNRSKRLGRSQASTV